MQRHWEALVLRAMGGRSFRLTVTGTDRVNGHYQRLHLDDGGLLRACGVHPTMWIRLWFDNAGQPHQRAYTLVDPDPAAGRFSLEFALHAGVAARWATSAVVGDAIEATVQGSGFALPDPDPEHLYLVGDAASLPAINSIFDAAPAIPATVWVEYAHAGEQELPLRSRARHTVAWVPRRGDGRHLVDTVRAGLPEARGGAFYWIAAEAGSTRSIVTHVRRGLGVDKRQISALAYWRTA